MARVEVEMPQMGESVMEGTVIEWSKSVGDSVEEDETLLEIATDKVDTEVPSPQAGILVEILAEEDETIEVGQPIAIIETDAEAAETASSSKEKEGEEEKEETEAVSDEEVSKDESDEDDGSEAEEADEQAASAQPADEEAEGERIEIQMPKMGESVMEGTVIEWTKNVGDSVEEDETLLEIATDKVDTEVPSPQSGTLVEILAEEDETIEVGQVIAIIDTDPDAAGESAQEEPEQEEDAGEADEGTSEQSEEQQS